MTGNRQTHSTAVRMLAVTTIFWSLSFPLVKAIGLVQEQIVPGSGSWFHASSTAFMRFACAGLVLAVIAARPLRHITALEVWQGVGLGFFGGAGILLQMDGLGHTSASTSAFLTQAFCVIVPLIVAIRDRIWPRARVGIAILLTVTGVAVLSNFDLRTFRLGRGEAETLLSAVFFAGQILWLDRPVFARNNAMNFSVVMFGVMALMSLPILVASWRTPNDLVRCYSNPSVLILSLAIILFCTIGAFVAMNRWQPFIAATEAAIIYSMEPVFASALALFLPGWISQFSGINYLNETVTWQMAAGGTLILGSNLLLQLGAKSGTPPVPASSAIT